MEAASAAAAPLPGPTEGPVACGLTNILWVMFAAILVYYFQTDFTQTLDDVKTGLSNGMIWALIALGYTLVYGIIELINFAHGEVFMIGSFVAVRLSDVARRRGGRQRVRDHARRSCSRSSSRCSRAARST